MTRAFFFRTIFLFGSLSLAGVLGALFFVTNYMVIDLSSLDNHMPGVPSIILDDEGNELGRFQLDRRKPVPLQIMPQHLINAFIAAEDWRFFEHAGISWKGIIRSLLVNLYHGRRVQGASTITQQLVRLLFLDTQKTFSRKIKEQLVAVLVERRFTKEQILQAYLNNVYFGCGIYGVEAACQRFWAKHVTDVTIDEAAVLAAVMRSPASYSPLLCPLSSERRRNIILSSMRKLGFITQEEYTHATAVPLQVQPSTTDMKAPYIKEMIRQMLEELFGKHMLYSGGLIIQTTINARLQERAQAFFHEHILSLRTTLSPCIDGGFISMEVATGQIKALIGGVDFHVSQFNRAIQARRQMGSIFKPLVYAAAIEKGAHFDQVELDEPIEVVVDGKPWRPHNNDQLFRGPMTLASALSHSNNIISTKTLLKYGVDRIIQLAQRCHLSGPLNRYPSLALGCVDASVEEAVGMFNIFANDGVYVQPHYIRWVKDRWGTKIWKMNPQHERILSSHVNGQVAKVLGLWFDRIHKFYPRPWIQSDAISKTGTTNDSRTCWFVGSTPEITTGMYIGCDDNRSMGTNIYPLKTAFPLWMDYNRVAESNRRTFVYDPQLHELWIDEQTGEHMMPCEGGAIAILV